MDKQISKYKLGLICTIALGLVFLFSGLGKMVVAPSYDKIWLVEFIPPMQQPLIFLLPVLESVIGKVLIVSGIIRREATIILAFGLLLIINFAVNNLWLIIVKKQLYTCGQCLGWGINTWPGASLFLDILMLGMAVTAVAYFRGYKKETAYGVT